MRARIRWNMGTVTEQVHGAHLRHHGKITGWRGADHTKTSQKVAPLSTKQPRTLAQISVT